MRWNDALTSQANGATNRIANGTRMTYASQYQADRRRRRRGRVTSAATKTASVGSGAVGPGTVGALMRHPSGRAAAGRW